MISFQNPKARFSSLRAQAPLLLATLWLGCFPARALAWGAMHSSITQAALAALPEWQQELLAGQRKVLIDRYCMIPDLAQAPVDKKELGPLVILPNGDLFCHLPFKTRDKNAYQIKYYLDKVVETYQANDLDKAARWAGCLLHFLEDSGSPAHTMLGDNQMGLMKDLIPTPDGFKDRPLHGVIEEGRLWVKIPGYKPRLLGTTTEEALLHLMERYDTEVRNARAQIIPILQATYQNNQEAVGAAQMRAAVVDAEVVADALYTLLSIAKGRFEPEETARLAVVDVSALTPTEVILQSHYPQYAYFSDPYFGSPVRNGILEAGKTKQPLVLNVTGKDGKVAAQEFEHGLGLGTGFRMTYALPGKVYERFECTVGLHASLGKEGKVAFKVFADGALVFDSGVVAGTDPAKEISVPIWGVKELALVTEGKNATKGHNYVVIGAPVLRKTADPQKLQEMAAVVIAEPIPVTADLSKPPLPKKTE